MSIFEYVCVHTPSLSLSLSLRITKTDENKKATEQNRTTYSKPHIPPSHGIPRPDIDGALPPQQPAREADVGDVGEPGADQVVADDLELRRGPEHGHAEEEDQPVEVAELQGYEAGVRAVGWWRG